nr:hypothetical protein [Allobaculum sp. Allo2]
MLFEFPTDKVLTDIVRTQRLRYTAVRIRFTYRTFQVELPHEPPDLFHVEPDTGALMEKDHLDLSGTGMAARFPESLQNQFEICSVPGFSLFTAFCLSTPAVVT